MNINKKIVAASLSMLLCMNISSYAPAVEALNPMAALEGALIYVIVGNEIQRVDNEEQEKMAKETKKRTGYLQNEKVQDRLKKVVKRIQDTKDVKRSYVAYVNPNKDYNAFMTIGGVMSVNKGAMDLLDDDELAYVVAHEIAHGEKRHVVNGVKKSIGLETALSVAVSDSQGVGSYVGAIASNYIENEMFTMSQEKEADELGYKYYTAAGYNPGAAASAMVIMRNTYGDHYREGLVKVISPNNHPQTGERVLKNGERLFEYSNKHVEVRKDTVYLNGDKIYKPAAVGRYTEEMRAYIMAGKMAKLYHADGKIIPKVTVRGKTVSMNDVAIITAASEKDAKIIGDRIQAAVTKKALSKPLTVSVENSQSAKREGSIMKKTEEILQGDSDSKKAVKNK